MSNKLSLQPIPTSDLGEYSQRLAGWPIYGLIRRRDLSEQRPRS